MYYLPYSHLPLARKKKFQILANTGLTNEEVIEGLKSALTVGTDTSVTVLNKLDGFYKDDIVKILLPEEAKNIYDNINKVPGGEFLLESHKNFKQSCRRCCCRSQANFY